ncbi:PucR family transcriptional regulator [Carnobacterium antarcticum]|uniref:PucR family transcriptional regulator n=1 Tax=Carnobacterium antarcticum TaxID=2126436 RepID=A0ABW4NN83_9LACT|nr:PucR family transcriptional regulator ligand-binding domain-containing protein [Carnobacterium sp. CP1]ALV21432.1 Regulator of polyketide synthase expression [Carnobacterium sp. CP1]
MTTLKELLEIPRFSNIRVLNTHADLSKEVDTIEITETPDVALYLPKNTFLLTTAMAFKDDPKKLCAFIQSLYELPAAGLGIKLGRFISELDEEVIAFADSLNFPLLQIPSTVTLGTVSHQLLSYIWNQQTDKLYYALDIQKKFSNMMIKDADLQALISHLGTILKRPVMLVNPFTEIVAESRHFQQDLIFANYQHQQLIPFLKKVQKMDKESSFLFEIDNDNKLLVSVFPIKINAYFPYLLVIFKADQIPYPFSQFAIEQANTVLSHTLYKNLKITESNLQLRETFFYQLTQETNQIKKLDINWLDYGKDYGLVDSSTYTIIIVNFENHESNLIDKELETDRYHLTYEWLERQLSNHFENALLFPIKDTICYGILLQKSEQALKDKLYLIHHQLKERLPISLHFSIGNEVSEITSIHFSYDEAKETYKIVSQNEPLEIIHYYQTQGFSKLIENTPLGQVEHFCITTLKKLAFPINEMDKELRKTLKVYLESQCDITLTSKLLFIHRNTVKYRIAKCEELFEMPVNDPDLSLKLRLALELSEENKTNRS